MLATQRPAHAADEYDTLRERWVGFQSPAGIAPTQEPFAGKLADIGSLAGQHQAAMTPNGTYLWPDLPHGSISGNITKSYQRLLTMAQAYLLPSTGHTDSTVMADAVVAGLDFLVVNAYKVGGSQYNNWWDWQIGSPHLLLDSAMIVYGRLTSAKISAYCAAIDYYVPLSRLSSYSGTSTGANRVDLCRTIGLRGLLGKDGTKITSARNALSPVFPFVNDGDGLYADGSFVQHSVIAYTGTYGAVQLSGLAAMLSLLAGSSWAVTDPNRQIVFDAVENAYAPLIFNGLVMDGVSGRGISRGLWADDPLQLPHHDHSRGHSIIGSILMLAEAASPAERARWRGLAKGWLQRGYWSPLLSDRTLSLAALARGKAVLDDAVLSAVAEPTVSRIFAGMDRVTHRRPGWAASISMCSTRTSFYEHGNGENGRGWHTSSGMLYTWGADWGNGQYSDHFWPTVDPYRLPGTTVSRKPLADAAGGAWGAVMPTNNWAGGATDGEFSLVGQWTQGLQSTLYAKKTWLCLDDTIVCLGAAITSTDGHPVESTIDNRNLGGGTGNHAFVVNGMAQPTTQGWSATLAGTQWAHNPFAGYVFPGGATIKAVRENRTGRWSDINGGGSATQLSRKYLTHWYDHGTNPTDATYLYLHMPGATASATQARAVDANWCTVLANTRYQQGVKVASRGVTAINFWFTDQGTPVLDGISVDQPAAVLIRQSGSTATIHLSDPRQNLDTITLTWQRPISSVTAKDSSVTVLETGTRLVLRFAVTGSAGRSHRAVVTLA